jgi:hypothetical protein
MDVLIWLGTPLLVGAILSTFLAGSWLRAYVLFGLGVLIAGGVFLYAYLVAPTQYNGCECNQVWGRWWDPALVAVIVGIGFFFWLLGVALGAFLNALWRTANGARANERAQ